MPVVQDKGEHRSRDKAHLIASDPEVDFRLSIVWLLRLLS
jgi:hypothetical protein